MVSKQESSYISYFVDTPHIFITTLPQGAFTTQHSTHQSSVFIRDDLKLQRSFLHTQGMTSSANKVDIANNNIWLI